MSKFKKERNIFLKKLKMERKEFFKETKKDGKRKKLKNEKKF